MRTRPMPLRLDKELHNALNEGARQTPHKKQVLIRLTLRLHLRKVIEREKIVRRTPRVTNIDPWPRHVVERAYRRIGKEWDDIENAATRAQGAADYND